MGVPSFYRWISQKYPKIISNVVEELARKVDGETVPVDASAPNPNGLEIDNLYLDMNGIIHPCCHPEDKQAPATEDEMYIEIFKYIDRIFCMIRPRKVLYMAIDGVAPRAKMNQQRSRRFRAAQEEEIKRKDEERIRMDMGEVAANVTHKEHFDSNCITPGTPFMEQLAVCLRYYIIDRLNNDPGWKNVQVFLSDASVPGEGEHKIMDYIRRQKTLSAYDPNTKHVLYGLDADLIMLALATHEPHFWILREDVSVKRNKERACNICGQSGHDAFQCTGQAKEKVGQWDDQSKYLDQKPFLFVHMSVLREYLGVELRLKDAAFDWNLERAIDDWVFMCFFVGNDFLPHLPSLEIREGAIELLIEIWKKQACTWDGYLTDSGEIRLDRVQTIMEALGTVEDKTFRTRREEEERRRISRFERKQQNKRQFGNYGNNGQLPSSLRRSAAYIQEQMKDVETFSVKKDDRGTKRGREPEAVPKKEPRPHFSHQAPGSANEANVSAAKKLKLQLLAKLGKAEKNPNGGFSMTDFAATSVEIEAVDTPQEDSAMPVAEEEEEEVMVGVSVPAVGAEPANESEDAAGSGEAEAMEEIDSDEEAPHDDVRLWEDGWKQRYYEKKFEVDVGDEKFRQTVVKSYVEGLCWVLKYYYQGVQSWKWFYPFHYSPFASDFKKIDQLSIVFEKSQPFKPVEQLLGVFPAASKKHIPPVFHSLMTDPNSPVIDFYPLEFPIDLNGKKHAWQGVALLPFIDADRLLKAVEPLYPKLTQEERDRNSLGNEVLFCSSTSSNFDTLCSVYSLHSPSEVGASIVSRCSKFPWIRTTRADWEATCRRIRLSPSQVPDTTLR
ncbi:5'-3' exoribonuclease 2 [Kappamyces sp. JEL0680]|nr:5'-3' exoribonuclease 2 [Kappamyces sp. JEL0680]